MEVRRRTLAKVLAVVFVANLVVMGAGAWLAYEEAPPIPKEMNGPDGTTVVSDAGIQEGKVVFQQDGMMNHGSILGNGAYYGVDYTADALDKKVRFMRDYYARQRHGSNYSALGPGEQAAIDSAIERELDRPGGDGNVNYSAAELYAHREVRDLYVERYHEGSPERGVPEGMIGSAEDAEAFADFAMWTAWFSHADRPGGEQSYTNNWPYQPTAGNEPGGSAMLWSVVSMVLLVAAAGAGVWAYKSIELPEPDAAGISVPEPGEVDLVPSQRAAVWFIPVAALLFVGQVLLGGLLAHYYVERAAFFGVEEIFGINILQALPFTIAKTWHIDFGILWIATIWLGAGLFLPALLTNYEPDKQAKYVKGLLGTLLVVTVGATVGIWLGSQGYLDGPLWWILGNEGLEY